jgi:cytochrome c oxidase subunit 3
MDATSPQTPANRPDFARTLIRFVLLGASVFFAAGLLVYLAARTGWIDARLTSGRGLERIQMPVWFWFSTLTILVSSLSLWGAKEFARNDDARLARRALLAATGLGYVFLILQAAGFLAVFAQHRAMAGQHVLIYALIAILFGLHAAHVIGGIIPLTIVAHRSGARPLHPERVPVLRYLGWYWHFLALVWFIFFNTMLLVG